MKDKELVLVSFSGGESSGVMAKRLHDEYSDQFEMRFAIANTGLENEETLVFADRCDREWGLGLVWLEAVVNDTGIACTHKIVTFETASRNGEPFEAMIQKYGIPNKAYPHCTRELKENTIRSYARSIGWADCKHAIGMRADEPSRIGKAPWKLYPLFSMFPTTKSMVKDWWEDQPFRLGLMDYQGNCATCWKKSDRKLIRIASETPEKFAFMSRMEATYGRHADGNPRTFFREHRSAKDILSVAELLQPLVFRDDDPDADSGCAEHCEPFSEETSYA